MKMTRKTLSAFLALVLTLTTLLGLTPMTSAAGTAKFTITATDGTNPIDENAQIEAGTKLKITWALKSDQKVKFSFLAADNPSTGIRYRYEDDVTEDVTRVYLKGSEYAKTFDGFILGEVTYTKVGATFEIDTKGQEVGKHKISIEFLHGNQDPVDVGSFTYEIKDTSVFKATVGGVDFAGGEIEQGKKIVIDWHYGGKEIQYINSAYSYCLRPYINYTINTNTQKVYLDSNEYTARKTRNSYDAYSNLSDEYIIDTTSMAPGTYTLKIYLVHGDACNNKNTHAADLFKNIDFTFTVKEKAPERVTVTFDANGFGKFGTGETASTTQKNEIAKGTAMGTPLPAFVPDEQYEFLNWNEKNDGTGATYTSASTFNANATVYAICKVKQFTVTVDPDGGAIPEMEAGATKDVSNVKYGATPKDFTAYEPTKTGYYFDGWKYEDETPFDEDHPIKATSTIVAKWAVIPAVTFNAGAHGNFGLKETTPILTKKVELSDDKPKEVPAVTADDETKWKFAGTWTDGTTSGMLITAESTPLTNGKTYTAEWNPVVTFNAGEAGKFAGDKETEYVEVKTGAVAPEVIPTGTGVTRDKWLDDEEVEIGDITKITEPTTFHATYKVGGVVLDPNGGIFPNEGTEPTDPPITVPYKATAITDKAYNPPYMIGSTFEGWYFADGEGEITDKKLSADNRITESCTLIAKYSVNPFVVFKGGEHGTLKDIESNEKKVELQEGKIGENIPEVVANEGWRFIGTWNGNSIDADTEPTSGTEYVADYIKVHTITYNNPRGSDDTKVVTKNVDDGGKLELLTVDDEDFYGWVKEGGSLAKEDEKVTDDLVLTAVYKVKLTFDAKDGTFTEGKQVVVDTFTNVLISEKLPEENPTKTNEAFAYWNEKDEAGEFDFTGKYPSNDMTFEANYIDKLVKVILKSDVEGLYKEEGSSVAKELTFDDVSVGSKIAGLYFKAENAKYEFDGWLDEGEKAQTLVGEGKDGDVTYFAKWNPKLTFKSGEDGEFSDGSNEIVVVGKEGNNAPAVTVTNDDKDFLGWYVEDDPEKEVVLAPDADLTDCDDPATYVAKYEDKDDDDVKVWLNGTGGKFSNGFGGKGLKVPVGTKTSTFEEPTRDGYNFVCWVDGRGNPVEEITDDIVLFAKWEKIEDDYDPEERQPEGWQGFHDNDEPTVEPVVEPVAPAVVPEIAPQTADSMNIVLMLIMAVMAAAIALFTAKKLHKEN